MSGDDRSDPGTLFIPCDGIHLFHGNRDEAFHAGTGMGQEKEFHSGEATVLRLLLRPLGGICPGGSLPVQTLRVLVAPGLFLNGDSHRVAERLPMDLDVLVDGEGREVKKNGKLVSSRHAIRSMPRVVHRWTRRRTRYPWRQRAVAETGCCD